MESIPDLHDASIIGIAFNSSRNELALRIEIEGNYSILLCSETLGWTLSPFERQNVIFEIRLHEAATIPAHLVAELPAEYVRAMEQLGLKCIEISPSVGLGGFVIARSLRYSDAGQEVALQTG